MYIAIEGIKGTGKSTIIEQINLYEVGFKYHLFEITKPIIKDSVTNAIIKTPDMTDPLKEQLFLYWAKQHNGKADKSAGPILGDRSILTSYVTRWNKWDDPLKTIKRVNEQYKEIRKPDVFIWLKNDPYQSEKNIANRISKHLGKEEEKIDSLTLAQAIYQELLTEGTYNKRIGKAQIITIDASQPILETQSEILNILKHYQKK